MTHNTFAEHIYRSADFLLVLAGLLIPYFVIQQIF